MQQSPKLNTIEKLLLSNKERELSYSKKIKLIWEDKVSDRYYSVIKEKYVWFHILDWVDIHNQLWYDFTIKNLYYKFSKVNFYIDSYANDSRWWNISNRTKLLTVFTIQNPKTFIHSLLEFIDNEKENLTILKRDEQARELRKEIDKLKGKFEMFKLPLTFNLSKFLSSYVQYYKTLLSLENQYKILDIQIYQWNITFTLSENTSNKVDVVFQENDLFIDSKKVFFQRKNTVIFESTKLIFSYFQEHNTYEVQFDELEQYYKSQLNLYPQISKVTFNYEYLRKSIETKSREIEGKHHLDKTFLGIDTSWIRCQYLQPENK